MSLLSMYAKVNYQPIAATPELVPDDRGITVGRGEREEGRKRRRGWGRERYTRRRGKRKEKGNERENDGKGRHSGEEAGHGRAEIERKAKGPGR